jgi:hypothetical protein
MNRTCSYLCNCKYMFQVVRLALGRSGGERLMRQTGGRCCCCVCLRGGRRRVEHVSGSWRTEAPCTGARQCVDEEDAPGRRRRGLVHRAHLGPCRTGFPALIALNLRLKIGLFCHFGSRQGALTGGLGPPICVVESDLVLSRTMVYALATRRRSP